MQLQQKSNLTIELLLASLLIGGVLLSAGVSHAEIDEVTESPKTILQDPIFKKMEDLIRRADLKLKYKKNIQKENFGAGAYWARRMEPSFQLGTTTLVDEYGVFIDLHPKELSYTQGKMGVGAGANTLLKFLFAREFSGNSIADLERTAVESVYYPSQHFPSNVQKLHQMNDYDFVSLQAKLTLVVSGGVLVKAVSGVPFPIYPQGQYLVEGDFQIHIQKLAGRRYRLKVFSIQNESRGVLAGLGFQSDSSLKFTRIRFVDNYIHRRFSFNPIEISVMSAEGQVFMLDYLLDFNAVDSSKQNQTSSDQIKGYQLPEVYDQMMDSILSLKTFKMLDVTRSLEESRQALLVDFSDFEKIIENEEVHSISKRTVERLFSGSNQVLPGGKSISITFGQRDFGQKKFNQIQTENFITLENGQKKKRYFYMPTYSIFDSNRAFLGLWDVEVLRTANMLFESDENQVVSKFGEMTFSFDYRDKKFKGQEIQNLRALIRQRVPKIWFDKISWKGWDSLQDRTAARVTATLTLRPKALKTIEGFNSIQLHQRLLDFIKSFPYLSSLPNGDLNRQVEPQRLNSSYLEVRFHEDLNYLVYHLERALDSNQQPRSRADSFMAMRPIELWQEVGAAFLVELLEHEAYRQNGQLGLEDMLRHVFFETTWQAHETDTVHEVFGVCQNRSLYQAVMNMYSLLHNRDIDMRYLDRPLNKLESAVEFEHTGCD